MERSTKLSAELQQLNKELREKHQEILQLNDRKNSTINANHENLHERLTTQKKEMDELSKKSFLEFWLLANKIFEDNTTNFSKTSKEKRDQVLNPLKENSKEFKKKDSKNWAQKPRR